MRFHASTERACRTAKRLRDTVNHLKPSPSPLLLGTAQRALAVAWGYGSWTELTAHCEAAPRSTLDEDAAPDVVAERASRHAEALARTLDIDTALAMAVVADAGLTARTPPSRPGYARAYGAHDGGPDGTGPFRIDGPLDGTSFERAMSWAARSLFQEVVIVADERMLAHKNGEATLVTPRPTTQAEVDGVVRHVYGTDGLTRARNGHDVGPDGLLDHLREFGPFEPSGAPYRAFVSKRGTTVSCRLPAKDPRGNPLGGVMAGVTVGTGEETWLSGSVLRGHLSVTGGTASTRRLFLDGLLSQAMAAGRGCMVVEPGGDPRRREAFLALARGCGREGDVTVLDLDGGTGPWLPDPFATGDAMSSTKFLVDLMDGTGSDGGMWRDRARALAYGVIRALTHLRDAGQGELDATTIRGHLDLRRVIDLTDESRHPDMPSAVRKHVTSYLTSLPGYLPDWGGAQFPATSDQHGIVEAKLAAILETLAACGRYAPGTGGSPIDMHGILKDRRLLLVTLPATGPGHTASMPGKVVLALLKREVNDLLGKGNVSDLRLPDGHGGRDWSPRFHAHLHDVDGYALDDMGWFAAQARAVGITLASAARDAGRLAARGDWDRTRTGGDTQAILRMPDRATAAKALGFVREPLRLDPKREAEREDAPTGTCAEVRDAGEARPAGRRLAGVSAADLCRMSDGEAYVVWPDDNHCLVCSPASPRALA